MPNTIPTQEGLLRKDQIAEWLQVTTRTIDDYMRKGLLPFYKIGRTVRFKLADVDAHLKDNCLVARRTTSRSSESFATTHLN
jgi:excisionase family DNA binding protein